MSARVSCISCELLLNEEEALLLDIVLRPDDVCCVGSTRDASGAVMGFRDGLDAMDREAMLCAFIVGQLAITAMLELPAMSVLFFAVYDGSDRWIGEEGSQSNTDFAQGGGGGEA